MHYLFVTSLLAALCLPLSVIAAPNQKCDPPTTLAGAWLEDWDGSVTPANLSWTKYNFIVLAFAIPTNENTLSIGADNTLLTSLVQTGHQKGVDVLASVGGYGGSQFFSSAVGPGQNVTTFINSIADIVSQYQVDGIEFDWEYPGIQQEPNGCNVVSSADTANFLSFLQLLRKKLGNDKLITATASLRPWVDPTGTPMQDVSEFASVLDRLTIMNYDVYGSWSTAAGPNAPLNDSCAPSSDQDGSAVSALKAWTSAKFPAEKIMLGTASYAHSFSVAPSDAITSSGAIALYPPANKADQPRGPYDTSPPSRDQCGNLEPVSGVFDFKDLIHDGYLTADGTNSSGIYSIFDTCSETPFIYAPKPEIMFSYDDARSFALKGDFIKANKLAGYSMWSVSGDENDILTDAINGAIDFKPNCSPS